MKTSKTRVKINKSDFIELKTGHQVILPKGKQSEKKLENYITCLKIIYLIRL